MHKTKITHISKTEFMNDEQLAIKHRLTELRAMVKEIRARIKTDVVKDWTELHETEAEIELLLKRQREIPRKIE